MNGRHWIGLLLFAAACSGATSTPTTTPVAGTSIPDLTASTVASLVDGGLVRINPATLVPEPGDPLVTGSSHTGAVSPNGQFAVIRSLGSAGQVTVIDLETERIVGQANGGADQMVVTDGGIAYYIGPGGVGMIHELGPGGTREISTGLADDVIAGPGSLAVLGDGRIVFSAWPTSDVATTSVIVIDGTGVETWPVSRVRAGFGDTLFESGLPVFRQTSPALVWDESGDRALLVSAEEDIVVEVALGSGLTDTHPWAEVTGALDNVHFGMAIAAAKGAQVGTRRTALLTDDGTALFVATEIGDVEGGEDDWSSTSSAQKLLRIDTATWEATVIDVEAWDLVPSPDGSALATMGATIKSDSDGGSGIEQGSVYIVETATGNAIGRFEATSGVVTDVEFSAGGEYLYIRSLQDTATIDIVDLAVMQLVGSVGFREMSLVGRAGLMAFHLDSG